VTRQAIPKSLAQDIEAFNIARARYRSAVANSNATPDDVRRAESLVEQRRTCMLLSLMSDRTPDAVKLEVLSSVVTSFCRDSSHDVGARDALSRVIVDLVPPAKEAHK